MALEQCRDINARDIYGNTALYWASLMGHHRVVEALLSDNAIDVNRSNSLGRTPLHAASMNATPGAKFNRKIPAWKKNSFWLSIPI